jgi:GT2 family glycosyltransferase
VSAATVSVVVCAYTLDRWEALVAAVASLERQSRRPDEVIVVIDHNPELLALAEARFPTARVIPNSQTRGLSGARNTAVGTATGELLAFLDDDAVGAENWLERLVVHCSDPTVLGVGGWADPDWQSGAPGWFPDEFLWVVGCSYRGLPDSTEPVRNLIGCSMLIRRSVIEGVGGFRTELGRTAELPMGCEETELCIRALQRWPGSRFLFEPSSKIVHAVPDSRARWRYFTARCYAEGISKSLVSRSVGIADGLASERRYALVTLPTGIVRELSSAVRQRSFAKVTRAGAIAAGFMFTAFGYVEGALTALLSAL